MKYGKIKVEDAKKQFPHEKFDEIIAGMEKEGIVALDSGNLSILA